MRSGDKAFAALRLLRTTALIVCLPRAKPQRPLGQRSEAFILGNEDRDPSVFPSGAAMEAGGTFSNKLTRSSPSRNVQPSGTRPTAMYVIPVKCADYYSLTCMGVGSDT